MSKRPLLLMLGITGDLAFAAGCLLLSLHRHSPRLGADIRIYVDDALAQTDAHLLRELGAELVRYVPPDCALDPAAIKTFSTLTLARLEGFALLDVYRTVLWLDVDTAIQDDITPLTLCGPLAMAREDPHFGDAGTSPASINVHAPLPGLDMDAPNCNAGVLVLQDSLPDAAGLHARCLGWLHAYGSQLKYLDQAVLNLLVHTLEREQPGLVHILSHDRYNAHPRNPASLQAAIVHAFGAYKLWDDGLTRCAFPEWQRDYLRWCALGGTPWQAPIDNADFLAGGPFYMLRRLFEATNAAQHLLEQQQTELAHERALRTRLEQIMARHAERDTTVTSGASHVR